jgi:hypothetical protein
VEWSLHGPLPKLCPVIPTFNQDGRQAKNRKKGGCNYFFFSETTAKTIPPKFGFNCPSGFREEVF